MIKKSRIVSFILCIALAAGITEHMSVLRSFGAGRMLNVAQAKTMALADNSDYNKLKSKRLLSQVKYQETVKAVRLKKKNMSTFRWTPLLSFKFPESPDLAEEFEFTYKPLQVQSEISSVEHELSVLKYKVFEEVGNKFTEVYTLQETIAFYEEQLENNKETLKRNRAKLLVGEAVASDISTMEKKVSALESKLAEKKRGFEKAKKKLGDKIGLDVTSSYRFQNPYVETSMERKDLKKIKDSALKNDQTYYEVKINTQLQRIALDTNFSLMKNQYGKKMNRLEPFIKTVKGGGEIDGTALKSQYDELLADIDAPWRGSLRILFIKIPKEWFKGAISGVRYIEDEPYALYTNMLEYQDAIAEEESAKKELLESVEDSYDNVITAKNAYETMKKESDSLKADIDAATLLNKAGSLSYEELETVQAAYEESQTTLSDALSTYTQSLYSLDKLSCGAVTDLMYPVGTSMQAVSGGDSVVTEEVTEDAHYYIRTEVEDNIFEVGILIPEEYEPEVTDFELWIDDVKIGKRTAAGKAIRHLALDKENAEKVVIRLYNGKEFVADCEIDPSEYEGPLKVVKDYKPIEAKATVAATYQVRAERNGMMELKITPVTEEKTLSYYTVEDKKGRKLCGEKMIEIEASFSYLSLASDDLEELRVRFYDNTGKEVYITEFDTDSLSLKQIKE